LSLKVTLLIGGWSHERAVSLEKGKGVREALIRAGYDTAVCDVTAMEALGGLLNPKPDVVFINLFGKGGEDGTVQTILNTMQIPYTHSGVVASAIGMDKHITKLIANSIGINCPKSKKVELAMLAKQQPLDMPFVLKPNNDGSSVGVGLIENIETLASFLIANENYDEPFLIEEYIYGREMHVAVLNGIAQGVTEIILKKNIFDYYAKYEDKSTELITPANIPEHICNKLKSDAEKIYNELGCKGLARCDFKLSESVLTKDDTYFLEINTIPSLSSGSIALIQSEANGIQFPELCKILVETALDGS